MLKVAEENKQVSEYISHSMSKSELERQENKTKTGVFTDKYVLNHVTEQQIPIWVSDFVLMNFGTGAVQGCPGHDLRDFEFAKTFGIKITRVVIGENRDISEIDAADKIIEKGTKGTMTNSERRISYLSKVIEPPGEARADAEILCDFARRMG